MNLGFGICVVGFGRRGSRSMGGKGTGLGNAILRLGESGLRGAGGRALVFWGGRKRWWAWSNRPSAVWRERIVVVSWARIVVVSWPRIVVSLLY